MRGSSVTAARSCLQPLVSASRYLAVHALPGDPLYFIVDVKSKVKEVYAQTCQLLGQQGMQDCELFGLAILSDGEYLFVDQENKLSKYAPKNWRSSHTYGLDSSGRPAFILYFRVRYYVDTPLILSDETTRHHYYLQLRDNVVRHGGGIESWQGQRHPLQSSSMYGPLLSLSGLALQADLGDYTEERHRRQAYCKPSDYLPAHMCHEENAVSVLAAHHRDNRGLSREEAEEAYIREAVLLEAPLNAHLYRLRRSKNEQGPGRALLAICARGVRVYGDEESPQVFTWNNIGKLGFDRKKFEIRAVDQPAKLTLFSGCDDKSKLLLALCRDTHQFFMSIAPRVTEAKRREEEERKVLRDYMYPARCKLSLTMRGSRADQRISLISSTSSNTTSGIVSDRVHSEDEPDATGPAANDSLAHGASSSSGSSGTSQNPDAEAHQPPPPHRAPLPCPGLLLTPADSQCSSTCSTVVAADPPPGPTTTRTGYLHDPQNSSSPHHPAEPVYDRCNKPPKYSVVEVASSETSGVYTLHSSDTLDEPMGNNSSVQSVTTDEASVTSGFYTIHSGLRSEASGSCYGGSSCRTNHDEDDDVVGEPEPNGEPIYSVCEGDDELAEKPRVDDGRSRSNSILSAGSFRGDGSDPSGLRGPLLSADELSDLIVGRYPPRKSIGASMDSDCDYVRMPPPPLPPVPPPRTDSERQLAPPPPYPGPTMAAPKPPPPPPPPGYHPCCPPPPSRERFREIPPPTPPRNDAVVPREPPPPPPPSARIQPPTYPGDKMKPTPVHAPVAALVVGPNNYLDVHATRAGPVLLPYLMPPQQLRQPPPPPPPPPPATAQQQVEQYKQQLYSDVDYVMFPLKDPALSKQEYIDAKQGSLLAAMAAAYPPPPPYPQPANPASNNPPLSYASNQNLSDTATTAAIATIASGTSGAKNYQRVMYGGGGNGHRLQYATSTGSLYNGLAGSVAAGPVARYGSPPPPLPPPASARHRFSRTRSYENILKSYECPSGAQEPAPAQHAKHRRLPPPPPPPPYDLQSLAPKTCVDNGNVGCGSQTQRRAVAKHQEHQQDNSAVMLEIKTLREKSRNLDLPLISALCNDHYLLKQTSKACVFPKNPSDKLAPKSDGRNGKHSYSIVSGLPSSSTHKPSSRRPSGAHKRPSSTSGLPTPNN